MSKLYSTINNDLVDPTLETKVDVEPTTEPTVVNIPDKLYAAITNKLETALADINLEIIPQTYIMPVNRLYTQITPERPLAMAEQKSYVYVPKVTRDSAGIAKFSTDQFNVIDGEVSIKFNYLTNLLSSNLITPDIVLVVTELPVIGEDNRIYLVPINSTTCSAYVWNTTTNSYNDLGNMSLDLTNYYNKSQIDSMLENVAASNSNVLVTPDDEPLGVDFYIKIEP